MLQADEARTLLDSIDISSLPGLRDRALIGLMNLHIRPSGERQFSMRIEDFYVQGRRGWVRLHEKGGKEHQMPTHHNLDHYLEEYIRTAGIAEDRKGPLFRTTRGRSGNIHRQPYAAARRLAHDSPPSPCGRHRNRNLLPYLPRHRHHGLPEEWWPA